MRVFGILFLLMLTACEAPDSGLMSRQPAGYSDGIPSKWKGGLNAFPLNLEISEDFESYELVAIDNAAESWSESVDDATQFFNTQNVKPNKSYQNVNNYQDSVMGIYKLDAWPQSLSSTALAVTQLFGYRKDDHVEIYHADILVNFDNFQFKTSEHEFGYDLETVILHEMGHFLGLYHENSSVNDSVMYPSIGRWDINRTPKVNDIQKLKSKYSIGMITPQSKNAAMTPLEANTQNPSEEVSLILELNADGKCRHYLNGELIHEH